LQGRLTSVSRSVAQAAETASAFRDANEQLEAKADELGFGARPTPYLCECEDAHCTDVIGLTRTEYEEVRVHPRRFVVVSGHQESDVRLVQKAPRFTVVEKIGEEGKLVAARNPRAVH
jgi:hypothetical protein